MSLKELNNLKNKKINCGNEIYKQAATNSILKKSFC